MANQQLTGLDYKIQEMAGRIRELREISGFTPAEMAGKTGVSIEEYLLCEAGGSNLTFAFLYRCALAFGVDVTDLIEGQSPKLRSYTLTRAGKGQKLLPMNKTGETGTQLAACLNVTGAKSARVEQRHGHVTVLNMDEIAVERRTSKGQLLINVLLDDVVEYAALTAETNNDN